jgi:hypothetical protein
MSGRSRSRKLRPPPSELPIFSDRLTQALEEYFAGQAPNVGRFCGFCYTPIDAARHHCPHCGKAVADHPPVEKIPPDVLEMFRKRRRRESLVVNSFAYIGLFSGTAIFIAVFYVLFIVDAGLWWYIFDIVLLFVGARVLAGLIGGFVGDELGYRYARRKLIEEWQAFAASRSSV